MALTIDLPDGKRLLAIPSLHYRGVFADAVNRTCRDRRNRPDAVAVELGPSAVDEAIAWLRELKVVPRAAQRRRGDGSTRRLPCMLGLVRPNRLLHPAVQERALQLQEMRGVAVEEIEPVTLREQLQFASLGLLCLSATDSIVEAIRVSVEENIPIHGVDLDEFAHIDRQAVVLEDPTIVPGEDVAPYVARNAAAAALMRDPIVDARRERAMASGLRVLLDRHTSVLFVCGLAHWTEIARLVRSDVPKVGHMPARTALPFLRVSVDPVIALQHMDDFPDLTAKFEAHRHDSNSAVRTADDAVLLGDKLVRAYEAAKPEDIHRIGAFMQFLESLCLLHQRTQPDIYMVCDAAAAIESPAFAARLSTALLSDTLKWVTPENHPELPHLRAVPFNGDDRRLEQVAHKAEIVVGSESSGPFVIDGMIPAGHRGQVPGAHPDVHRGTASANRSGPFQTVWAWPPWEDAVYGTAYQAAELAQLGATRGRAEPFAGSLLAGLHMKATVRAFSRGDRRVFVGSVRQGDTRFADALTDAVVFIFTIRDVTRSARFEMSGYDVSDIEPFFVDRGPLQRKTAQGEKAIITRVLYVESAAPEATLRPWVSSKWLLSGLMVLPVPCSTVPQAARWMEQSRCASSLFAARRDNESVWQAYRDLHDVALDPGEWRETLVRMAIPYVRDRVVVVAPDGFRPTPRSLVEAKRRGKGIVVVPLSYFSKERIAAVRTVLAVYAEDDIGVRFSPGLEAAVGQRSDAYRDLVPPRVRALLRVNR